MGYDFSSRVDRTGMASIRELTTPDAVKNAGLISCWGAEFEFKTAPFIIQAIKDWADKGLAAYCIEDDALLNAIRNWMKYHRNWEIRNEWIVPTYGLTCSVATICRTFTNPGDGIIGLGPVYHMTWEAVELNGRVHIDCPLLFDGNNYSIDYINLEKVMAKPENKVFTFCNPHNPIAKVWGREDLVKIAGLAIKYDKIIYSDEIFADTVYEGVEMLTFDQVVEQPLKWIVATSLGKTYSMTGIGQANLIIRDEKLRERFINQRDIDHYGSFNPMMRAAYFAGYTEEGSRWVKEMMNYCYENYLYLDQFLKDNIPEMKVIKPDGSYILWIDCRGLRLRTAEEYETFLQKAGFACDEGSRYGSEPGFVRMNLSAPKKELERVMEVLNNSIKNKN
jgi:cystathionine beta-lyase